MGPTDDMPASIPGIHHVTCITGDVQRNVDFYVTVLGLRFIKKTVNFDVPDTYHLYFADYLGTPGTAMTFFGWPHLPWRAQGAGQVAAVSFAIPSGAIDFWADRLREFGVEAIQGTRFDTDVITFRDADEMRLELVGEASDERWTPWPDGPVAPENAIRGFHSVSLLVHEETPTASFLTDTFGFREVAREAGRVRFQTGAGGPHALLEVVADSDAPKGEEAVGTVHHVAWRAPADDNQLAWREALVGAGRQVTPVINRKYFQSIYFREPGGVLFEIATDQPGFTVDEPPELLGSALQLPPQYEGKRENLNFNLPPIVVPTPAAAAAPRAKEG
jgi:glyoxalase family protein